MSAVHMPIDNPIESINNLRMGCTDNSTEDRVMKYLIATILAVALMAFGFVGFEPNHAGQSNSEPEYRPERENMTS